jgi:hypothetical protein
MRISSNRYPFEKPLEKAIHPLPAEQAQPAESHPPHIRNSHRAAGAADVVGGGATGICGGDDGTRADAGNAMDGNSVLFKDSEHTGVRNAAREAAA